MQNLDQLRATNALEAAGGIGEGREGGGNVAKKVPAMIRENGILGAAAFASETKAGYKDVFKAIIEHLGTAKRLPGCGRTTLEGFISDLAECDAGQLRAITAEAMAYLGYLRRFAGQKGGRE
jgi:CRISPR/Cas system CMR-associated protein Cmr5 small subunit